MIAKRFVSLGIFLLGTIVGCTSVPHRPCSSGGQPARSGSSGPPSEFHGKKKCDQAQDERGVMVNHGKYYEWDEDDRISVVGEYKMGKKHGRWIFYDSKGQKSSEQYFEDGREVAGPS